MQQEILQALHSLFIPGDTIEIRTLGQQGEAISHFFSDMGQAARYAANVDGTFKGVYVTLNPVDPTAKPEKGAKDEHIARRVNLGIDFDPIRPADVSSTEEEHKAAIKRARACRDFLSERGWPEPILADSGNGSHLVYGIELPNNEEAKELLRLVLIAVEARFSDDVVNVDRKVFNASRIWKLYGTKACKGKATPERPHRKSQMLEVPELFQSVSETLLRELAAEARVKQSTPLAGTVTLVASCERDLSPYVQAAVRAETERVSSAVNGTRNNTLNEAAFALGTLVGTGELDEGEAVNELLNAANQSGLSAREASKTIASGLEAGKGKPRDLSAVRTTQRLQSKEWSKPREQSQSEQNGKQSKIDVDDIAQIWGKEHKDTWSYDNETNSWMYWSGTHWIEHEKEAPKLCTHATRLLKQYGHPVNSDTEVKSLIKLARDYASRTFTYPNGLVNFSDCTLDTKTMTKYPHRREDGLRYCLPYTYQPGETLVIDKAIREIAPDDPAAGPVLKTHIGLALMGDITFHKTLLFLGMPGTGKSTLLDLALMVMGMKPGAYAPALLYDKGREGSLQRAEARTWPITVMDEFPAQALRDEETFKIMSTHKGIDSRMHNSPPVNAEWRPKGILAANDMPEFKDKVGAIRRRLILIECPVARDEADYDLHLLDKMQVEVPAFAASCIEYANAAIKEGKYPISTKMLEDYDNTVIDSDPVKAFVAECCVLAVDNKVKADTLFVSSEDLFNAWNKWAGEGANFNNKITFTKRLKGHAPWKLISGQTPDKKARGLNGIALKAAHPKLLSRDELREFEPRRAPTWITDAVEILGADVSFVKNRYGIHPSQVKQYIAKKIGDKANRALKEEEVEGIISHILKAN